MSAEKIYFDVEAMRRPPFSVASAIAIGTWMSVQLHAVEVSDDGRVPGAAAYTDERWRATTQRDVTCAKVTATVAEGLLRWEGDDLIVVGFVDAATAEEGNLRAATEEARSR